LIKVLLLIGITFLHAEHNSRCSFGNINLRIDRPETQSYAFSSTGHFKIHYDITGQDAPSQIDLNSNSVPDYIEEVAVAAENARNIFINDMGYLPEIPDGDGVYDIYIEDRAWGAYGVNYPDHGNYCSNCSGVVGASWIIIDNEYEEGSFLTSGLNTMRLTVAHEFFHAIQQAYVLYPGSSRYFWEMTATWVEDIVVPDGNDYIYWVDQFFNNPDQDISDTDGYSIALFSHYLSSVIEGEQNLMESNIIREIWEHYATSSSAFSSIKNVLENQYNSSFAYAWGDFCSRSHFSGVFDNMDNEIYYYPDQLLIEDTFNLNEFTITENLQTGEFIFNNGESAAMKKFTVNEFAIINFNNFLSYDDNDLLIENIDYEEFISIKPSNEGLNQVIQVNDNGGPYILYENDNIFLTVVRDEGNGVTTLEYDIEYDPNPSTPQNGDTNLNGTVDIVDIVLLISYIFGNISLNEMQIDAANVSGDEEEILNIFDILLLIDIILDS